MKHVIADGYVFFEECAKNGSLQAPLGVENVSGIAVVLGIALVPGIWYLVVLVARYFLIGT